MELFQTDFSLVVKYKLHKDNNSGMEVSFLQKKTTNEANMTKFNLY